MYQINKNIVPRLGYYVGQQESDDEHFQSCAVIGIDAKVSYDLWSDCQILRSQRTVRS
jgi:hypothetical protein